MVQRLVIFYYRTSSVSISNSPNYCAIQCATVSLARDCFCTHDVTWYIGLVHGLLAHQIVLLSAVPRLSRGADRDVVLREVVLPPSPPPPPPAEGVAVVLFDFVGMGESAVVSTVVAVAALFACGAASESCSCRGCRRVVTARGEGWRGGAIAEKKQRNTHKHAAP